jgi:FixJ family two-component response regulator
MVRETVFVVDDDEAVRDSTAMLLAAGGFTVQTFPTGMEFLTACNGHGVGCAVIDIHMPEMDGFAVVEALSARKAAVSVILITGRRDAAVEKRAQALGVTPVLEKPLGRGLLIQVVRAALSPGNES